MRILPCLCLMVKSPPPRFLPFLTFLLEDSIAAKNVSAKLLASITTRLSEDYLPLPP